MQWEVLWRVARRARISVVYLSRRADVASAFHDESDFARIAGPKACPLNASHTEHRCIPIPRPEVASPTGPVTTAASRLLAARRTSCWAARTASCIVNSGVPRCIESARHPRAAVSVRATTTATLCTGPRVSPTQSRAASTSRPTTDATAVSPCPPCTVDELQVLARVLGGHTRQPSSAASRNSRRLSFGRVSPRLSPWLAVVIPSRCSDTQRGRRSTREARTTSPAETPFGVGSACDGYGRFF